MNRIEWKDEYNIGIAEIDEQHQHLMEMINNLINSFSPINVHDTVMQMGKYADTHFEFEEKLMIKFGCDQLQEHKKQHEVFRHRAIKLAGKEYSTSQDGLEAFNYLCGWLANHILTMDKRYKECFLSAHNSEGKSK